MRTAWVRVREAGDDAEVAAAAAAAGPVEVGVLAGVGGDRLPVGGHDRERPDVVGGGAERPPGQPHPAAQREPADADRRARAAGDGEAARGERRVHVDEPVAGADLHRRCRRARPRCRRGARGRRPGRPARSSSRRSCGRPSAPRSGRRASRTTSPRRGRRRRCAPAGWPAAASRRVAGVDLALGGAVGGAALRDEQARGGARELRERRPAPPAWPAAGPSPAPAPARAVAAAAAPARRRKVARSMPVMARRHPTRGWR